MGWEKSLKYWSFLVLAGGCFGPLAFGTESNIPGSNYTSARGAGMGDAYIPFAQGAEALFYNPAGIALTKTTSFDPIDLSFYGNNNLLRSFSTNFYNAPSLSGYASTLESNAGSFMSSGMSLFPSFSTRFLSFGVLYQADQGAVAENGSLSYKSNYELIPTVGTGFKLAEGIIRVGYSLQWVNLATGSNVVPQSTTPLGYNQQLLQGSGISNNVGFAITLPVVYLPAFNIVARNIGGIHYSGSTLMSLAQNTTGTPADQAMSIDASLSARPKLGSNSYVNLSLEYRDLTSSGTVPVPVLGKISAGAEAVFGQTISLRTGLDEGYPTFGVGFKKKKSELDFTWYTEDIGDGYHVQGDTRFMVQYRFNVF